MSRRQSFLAYTALLLGVITFAASFVRPTAGQQPVPAPATVGRYQMAVGGSSGNHVYVIDTATGKTWFGSRDFNNSSDMGWKELQAIPVAK